MRALFILGLLVFLAGCTNRIDTAYMPGFLAEKRTQATRKGEIIKNLRPVVSVFATHLNEVDPASYHQREFFFIEIFAQDSSVFENDVMTYKLYALKNSYTPMWVRPISKDEFDSIFYTTNKYAKAYLVAFPKLDYLSQEEAKLEMDLEGLGTITFNFAYSAPTLKF
ncbi:hypothetical protein [Helicobacter suis]|uniref:hypothetical protein n=1 Tax=Helicobacter suis TaxID=104628 RepID=UPI00248F9D3C|nr:hypothetical protein [Helicobacter suis]